MDMASFLLSYSWITNTTDQLAEHTNLTYITNNNDESEELDIIYDSEDDDLSLERWNGLHGSWFEKEDSVI